MSIWRRLMRRLFPPDCDLCGGYAPHKGLLGSWWHADNCPRQRPDYAEGSDAE